jgi:CBS domain-containing protein
MTTMAGRRTVLGDGWTASSPVSRRMRALVWADAGTTVGEAAALLAGREHSCVLVRLPDGLGIATDHDFRASLADPRLSRESPVGAICSVPAATVTEHTDAPTALLEMVERGIHHLVVTTDTGHPVGVVRLVDLASAELRDPLLVRHAVHAARTLDELVGAAALLPSTVAELVDIGTPALQVAGILSAVRDQVVQRAVALSATKVPTDAVSWLVLGSLARREALPDSDVDTALAWPVQMGGREAQLRSDADVVLTGLERCGLSRCPDGANATEPLFSRSVEDWTEATRRWTEHPESESALLLASIVADNRAVTGVDLGRALTESMLAAARNRRFLDGLLTFTLAVKPQRGVVRDFAVERTGPYRGTINLKRGGLWPVVLLGRWLALAVGDVSGSTVDRIRRGGAAGLLTDGEAEGLVGAFELIFQLRFDQETHLAPEALDPLRRNYLRDSLRAVAAIQAGVSRAWASYRPE